MKKLIVVLLLFFIPSESFCLILRVPSEYSTIQDGIDAAVDGDTVLVYPGTYEGSGNVEISFYGKEIVVMSQMGPDSTIIDCQWYSGFIFNDSETSSSVLKGFTLFRTLYGIFIEGASPLITDCVIDSSDGFVWGGSAITVTTYSSPTIMNCRLTNCFTFNSSVFGPALSVGSSSALVINCEFSGCYSGTEDGVVYCSGSDVTFENCTFTDNYPYALSSRYSNTTLRNCIFWDNAWDSLLGNFTITYSDIEGGETGEGNIDEDPLFIDPESGDFRLSSGSPCIDTGDPDSPNVPWGGFRRDMGAFEYDKGFYFDGQNTIYKPDIPVPLSDLTF